MANETALIATGPGELARLSAARYLVPDWQRELERQVKAGAMANATRRTYQIGAERFLSWCEAQPELSAAPVLDWIGDQRAQGRKPAAVNTWLAGVRSLFKWAASTRQFPYNPAADVRGAKRRGTTRKHARDALTDREVTRVLAAPDSSPAGYRDRAVLALMAYTAARTIELHRADLADLKTEAGRLVLQVQGKGRAERDEILVIAHPRAEAAVRDWLAVRGDAPGALFVSLSDRSQGERLSLRALRGLVKHYYQIAGVCGENKTTHSLRHAAITNAVKRGAPIQKVRAMARHASLETTMIYYHEVDRIENPAEAFIEYEAESGD